VEPPLRYDVSIIGAGPAGLTAAIYAGRALLSTLVLEKAVPGGQLNETEFIENFPGFEEKTSAPELMKRMHKQAERLGAEFILEEVTDLVPTDDVFLIQGVRQSYCTRAVIIASGSRPRELEVEGEKRLKGKGLSYCATCDGYFFQEKRVLVVGAGDSALTEALFLSRFATSVGIIVRHPKDDPHALRASPILQREAFENPKIHFIWNKTIETLLGEKHLTGVVLKDLATGDLQETKTDGLFVNIGHLPETEYLRGTATLDEHGYVITDDHLGTNLSGVFAAGDVRIVTNRYAQAVVAAGDGAIAAIEVEKYLSLRHPA
jgi:thioredoxin reductase (NADPH)